MKKKFVIAANWKMYKNPQEAQDFFQELKSKLEARHKAEQGFYFFVPALVLSDVLKAVNAENNLKSIFIGLQNIYYKSEGAFTGENSPQVARQMGAHACLIGHSERRSLFIEKDADCNSKMKAAFEFGMTPVLCVGESLEERQKGQTMSVISTQLLKALEDITENQEFLLAYEPVWAIGTGQVATPDQAQEAHAHLRQELVKRFGKTKADSVSILYGGSVKPENAKELSHKSEIDGFLIGGASLKVSSLMAIAEASLRS